MPCKRFYESEKNGDTSGLCPLFQVPCVHPEKWWPWSNCRLAQAKIQTERTETDLQKERQILLVARQNGVGISFEKDIANI